MKVINEYITAQQNLVVARTKLVTDLPGIFKAYRLKYNWTQAHLGKLLSVDNTAICKIESGDYIPEGARILKVFVSIIESHKVSPS